MNYPDRNDKIEIKLARAEDSIVISRLLYESFREIQPVYTQRAFEATVVKREEVLARMIEGPVWLALYNDEIIGTVSSILTLGGLYMRGMAVHPKMRGKNIGRQLLEKVESYAKTQACHRVYLSTTPYLESAIRLYQNFGFVRTEEPPHDLFKTPLFTMEKKIT